MALSDTSVALRSDDSWWGPPTLRGFAIVLGTLLATASLFLLGPQVEADEGSYLLNAATIVGRLGTGIVHGYYSGYSLLLTPAFLLWRDPTQLYHAALFVNALLVASTPFALYRLTHLLWPQLDARQHVAAAVAATCYAPLLMLSQYTMSESALVPMYAWFLASGATVLYRPRTGAGIVFGCVAGGLLLVHPRGAMIAAPGLALFSLFACMNVALRRPLAAAWLAALAVAAMHMPLEHLARKTGASGGYSATAMLARFAAPSTWLWLALNLIGTMTEAIAGSIGMVVFALRAAHDDVCRRYYADDWRHSPRAVILLAVVCGMLVAMLTTAAFFAPPDRADQLAYGRYALPTLVPLIAIGLIRLYVSREARWRDTQWAIAIGLGGIAIMGIAFTQIPPALTTNWNFINAIGFYLVQRFSGPSDAWWGIALCFIASSAVLYLSNWHSAGRAVAIFALLNVVVAISAWLLLTLPYSKYYNSDRHVVEAARAFEEAAGSPICVNLGAGIDAWHAIDLSWHLFPQLATRTQRPTQCARGTIQALKGTPPAGMRLVAVERASPIGHVPVGLFIEDGPALAAFARTQTLPPATALRPVPAADRYADITINGMSLPHIRIRIGSTVTWSVGVTNRGASTWPAPASADLPYPVLLGASARDENGVEQNYRTALPHSFAPGQSGAVPIKIGPFKRTGQYQIRIGILQEHIAWFSGSLNLTIDVVDARS